MEGNGPGVDLVEEAKQDKKMLTCLLYTADNTIIHHLKSREHGDALGLVERRCPIAKL